MSTFFELNSIRSRMVSGFLFLTFLIFIIALVSLFILDRNNEITRIHSNINQLEILTLSLIKSDNDFLDLDATNDVYFTTRTSKFLTIRDSLNLQIEAKIKDVTEQQNEVNFAGEKNLRSIDSTLTVYNTTFKTLEELVFARGFKDYGMEGLMRFYAHRLEEEPLHMDITKLLYLRRHEKDFFLRNDHQYITKFNNLQASILASLERNERENQKTIYNVTQYSKVFNELVAIETRIGLTSTQGLLGELNGLTDSLSKKYFELAEFSYQFSSTARREARVFYLVTLAGAFLFSLLSGLWISKRLSEPIARLSRMVGNASQQRNPTRNLDLNFRYAANEINTLTKSFIHLMDQTKNQMQELKTKSKLLRKKNKQLKKLNRELDRFLYSTAHDLRSPLTSLLGLINLMRHDNTQENLVIYLDLMEKSVTRSENFITQIVSFSKNKRMDIQSEEVNLDEIIHDVFQSQAFIQGNNRISKDVTIESTCPLYSDRNRITILFNNLISNAIRYFDPAKNNPFIKIDVRINIDMVTINFRDNGVGINEEHIAKIFDMFYRANTTSNGSGLGLFIFQETLKRLQGQVTVTSVVGEGTMFLVTLPNLSKPAVAREVENDLHHDTCSNAIEKLPDYIQPSDVGCSMLVSLDVNC